MTTSTSQKALCASCDKVTGSFTCRGCQKDFCIRHVVEHRQELGKKMDELTLNHDRFRQNLIDQTTEPQQHSLMKQIDEWEQKSIDKIRRTADDVRKQLQITINEHTSKLTDALVEIANELRKAREDNDFFESDLEQWTKKLDELEKDLIQPSNIKIQQDDNGVISLSDKVVEVVLSKETFGRSMNGIQIEDNDQIIVKKQGDAHTAARGSGEYTSGQHRFRFNIGECDQYQWLLIGIISKDVAMEANSYSSLSSYGWAGGSQVYLNGISQIEYQGYKSDTEENDILELFVDCERQTVRLTNERTQSASELIIEMSKCPFPWQLNFNLYYSNDRVRIL
jgi:hypothetical protein